MKKLYSEIAVIVMILIVTLTIGVLMYKNKVKDSKIEDLKRQAYGDNVRDSIAIDYLKFKILQDSLHIVDIQRVNYINTINQQDDKDKGNRDIVIAIIPNANDEQRDRIWTAYSPKN
jgi:phosphoribulokinase